MMMIQRMSALSSKFSYVYTLTIKSPLAGLGTQGMHTSHNIRDLDRDEGAALHAHLFEEQIDWTEPLRKHPPIHLNKNSN